MQESLALAVARLGNWPLGQSHLLPTTIPIPTVFMHLNDLSKIAQLL